MNILKGKETINETKDMPWKKINFTIFGLGNTQYEHYNETGRAADRLFEKNGANRIYELGEGDDNCSLEDDFFEWRKGLWTKLIAFRKANPFVEDIEAHHNVNKMSS
jgi:sulfite reductase alpha subunit-like flavoprotein